MGGSESSRRKEGPAKHEVRDMESTDDFYGFEAKRLDGTTLKFAELRGKVVLIENVASL